MDPINLQYTTIKIPLPEFIYDEVKEFVLNSNTYQPQPKALKDRLIDRHGIKEDQIWITAGCDEAIQMFIHSLGKTATVFTPTYIVYADTELFGGRLDREYSFKDNNYSIEPKRYSTDLIFLANPNNPFGNTSKENIIKLIELNSESTIIIDEAYGEFGELESSIDLVKKYKNLAVIRSFSKDFAMAGARIGYVVADASLILKIKDHTQWANISYASVGMALAALNHEDYFINLRKEIRERREDFKKFLIEKQYNVLSSNINALLIKFNSDIAAKDFLDKLNKNNIVVSFGNGNSNIGLDETFVRISIGSTEQMEKVKEVLK